jgi:hypothetical protein
MHGSVEENGVSGIYRASIHQSINPDIHAFSSISAEL